MSLKIRVTEQAADDAITIAEYLAGRSSLNMSDKFLTATTQTYRQLADMPGMGSFRDYGPDFPSLRMWHVPKFTKYLIFHQATETELIIRRILHGAQNIERIFRPDEG